MIEIVVDGNPVGKGRPRFLREIGRKPYPDAKTLSYENLVGWTAQQVMRGRPLLAGALIVVISADIAIPKSKPKKWRAQALARQIQPVTKPDLDNIVKGICDALNGVVYVDDSQIVELQIAKLYSERPRVTIRISEL